MCQLCANEISRIHVGYSVRVSRTFVSVITSWFSLLIDRSTPDPRAIPNGIEVAMNKHHILNLGPVDNHLAAAKLLSVLSCRVATARNFLILAKKFSIWCRHLYISRSRCRGTVRFCLEGITASAPRALMSPSRHSASKALSPTKVPNGRPPAGPARS